MSLPSTENIKKKAEEYSAFSACDKIAAYYESIHVPSRVSFGPLGGKSFTWYVNDSGQAFQVFCACNLAQAGLGQLWITSRMASERPSKRFFTSTSDVDPKTAKVILQGALLQKHEITLPTTVKRD
jgi:hypothetical protein